MFVVAHELIHRRVAWQRRLGEFLLTSASYPTYATEHVYIHHARVGTPHDVGSAPKGESFWSYLPNEVVSNITNSWAVDRERLARRGLPVWHYTNPFWRYGLGVLFWYVLAYMMGGIWAIPVFIFLGFGCVFSMKISNYLQHYGLRRVVLPSGRWEKVAPRHSWSADWKFSNWMFFNMQRHADHHATASRHYPLLQVRGPDESPELPGTYADMMNIVLRPRRWFEKMDPLVEQWRSHFYPDMDDWSAYDSPVAMSRPDDFPVIAEIFAASPRLASRIERNPNLLDSLTDREFTDIDLPKGFVADPEQEAIARRGLARVYWTFEMDVPEMVERIGEWPAADAAETVRIVQGWSNDKAFQISMHVVRGNLAASEAQTALSNLAEASVRVVLDAVVADLVERFGPLDAAVGAVMLGDLAVGEAQIGAGLDMMFVHDGEEKSENDRVGRRFRDAAAKLASDSLLFSPDSGDPATAVIPLSGLGSHCRDHPVRAVTILTKSRCVFECGETEIGRQFDEAKQDLAADEKLRTALLSGLQESRAKAGAAAPDQSPVTALRGMPGGLLDCELAARFLQLRKWEKGSDLSAAGASRVLSDAGENTLGAAALSFRDLRGILALTGGAGFDISSASSSVKRFVAESCGEADFESLAASVGETASAAAERIDTIFARN